MSGFLSRVFEPESGDGSAAGGVSPGEGGDGYSESGNDHSETSSHGSEQSTSADADTGVGIDLTVPLHLETGAEYQIGDESGGWSNTIDATLTVSTDAVLGAAGDVAFGDDSASY
jgi:hypothetical protein